MAGIDIISDTTGKAILEQLKAVDETEYSIKIQLSRIADALEKTSSSSGQESENTQATIDDNGDVALSKAAVDDNGIVTLKDATIDDNGVVSFGNAATPEKASK